MKYASALTKVTFAGRALLVLFEGEQLVARSGRSAALQPRLSPGRVDDNPSLSLPSRPRFRAGEGKLAGPRRGAHDL
eukprot:6899505-Prymnesium_polylepis.1